MVGSRKVGGGRSWAGVVALGAVLLGVFAASAAALPSGRGYELVSPPDKKGGDVSVDPSRTRAAEAGGALQFTSLTGFGDVGGMSIGTEYVSKRTGEPGGTGWDTHAIAPLQESLSVTDLVISGLDPRYLGDFSADLGMGIFLAKSPLNGDSPNTDTAVNLYLRRNVLSPGRGQYTLISGCPACVSPLPADNSLQPAFAAANRGTGRTAPFSHILFESTRNLAAGATGALNKVYEWSDGEVRLAGILPNGSPAPSSAAGIGGVAVAAGLNRYTENTISRDGSKVFFTSPVTDTGACSGACRIYRRENGLSTVELNRSERTVPDTARAARFEAISDNGAWAFFTTAEALVDDDSGVTSDLYLWRAEPATEVQQLSVEAGAGTYTLSFGSDATGPLPYDADAATIEAALNALPAVSGPGGTISVSGSNPFTLRFGGSFANQSVGQVGVNAASLAAAVGKELSCTGGPTSGGGVPQLAYQWLRNGTAIPGANGSRYTVQGADAGAVIQCSVTAINTLPDTVTGGFAGTLGTSPTGILAAPLPATAPPTPPVSIAAPTVAGGALTVGSDPAGAVTLRCVPGTWTGSPTFTYQWYRSGVPLVGNGATTDTYTVQAADLATRGGFQCVVTGANAGGAMAKASANRITTPGPAPGTPTASAAMSSLATSSEISHGGHLTRVSASQNPRTQGLSADVGGVIDAADSGQRVYFVAQVQLAADGRETCGSTTVCIFVWDDGVIKEVAQTGSTFQSPPITQILIAAHDWRRFLGGLKAYATPDGNRLAFVSEGLATEPGNPSYNHGTLCNRGAVFIGTTPECGEVYVYDARANGGEGRLACASCNPDGTHISAVDAMFNVRSGTGASAGTQYRNRAITDDGSLVLFSTGDPLRPEDQNGTVRDVYAYETFTGNVRLVSSGRSTTDSFFLEASGDGRDIFFATRERLVGWDTDGGMDVYTARLNGGMPEPRAPPSPCASGDTCQGAGGGTVDVPRPGSLTFEADGAGGDRGTIAPVFAVEPLTRKQLRRWQRRGSVVLTVTVSQRGTVRVLARARVNGRARTVASARRAAEGGGTVILRLRLSRQARARLKATGRLTVTLSVRFSEADGARKARVTLRSPRG